MATKMTKVGPKLSEADIERFEKQIGFSLPESYRSFLSKFNGGSPEPYHFAVPKWRYGQSLVTEFNGITPGKFSDIGEVIETLEDRLPKGFIPIAGDPGGNVVLLSLDGPTRGKVYFWDHENEPEEGTEDVEDYPNVYLLADDFQDFLNNLRNEDELGTSDTGD